MDNIQASYHLIWKFVVSLQYRDAKPMKWVADV